MRDRLMATLRRLPVLTTMLTGILTIFGLALIIQSDRWYRTPAYGDLLHILSADAWGVIYLGVAAALAAAIAARRWHSLAIAAHTLAIILFAAWDLAFVVRYLTDSATTAVNVVSWATYTTLAVWSALSIDEPSR